MDKQIVLFDFDRTLFNNPDFGNWLSENIAKIVGTDISKIQDVQMKFISSLIADREYSPENFTKFICDKFDFNDQQSLLDLYYGEENAHVYKDFIFPEVGDLLTRLVHKYRLGLYSEGYLRFQNHKITSTGIMDFFEKDLVFILENKSTKEAINGIPAGSIVIDDKKTVCEYLTKSGIRAIWLNRKGEPDSNEFPTIHTLLEVEDKLLTI